MNTINFVGKYKKLSKEIRNNKVLLLFMLPAIVSFAVFCYAPMYGLIIAFQEYSPVIGFWQSPFVGFTNFVEIFRMPDFTRALRNTIVINLLKILFGFTSPIIFALFLNEITKLKFKRSIQTISYLPYFVSWVVASGIWYKLLSIDGGPINDLLMALNVVDKPVYFMSKENMFYPIIILTDIWKNLGWNSIIYLAALSGIDLGLYDSAKVDGAGRFKQMFYISLPGLKPAISMLFILTISSLMNSDFDQLYTMGNVPVREVGDVLDTLILRVLQTGGLTDYSYGVAMGLFKNVIGFGLFFLANYVFRRLMDESII